MENVHNKVAAMRGGGEGTRRWGTKQEGGGQEEER